MTTNNQKKLALIGCGRWGKNLARNFHHLGALHTICDMNEASLDQLQKSYNDVHLTANISQVLDDPWINKVAIAAPASHHYKLAKQALENKKDVFVEKPLCLDIHEAEDLISIAKKKGCILMVGHLLQYHPCIKKLQELLGSGELGRLQYITSNRLNLGSIRTEENALWSFAPHDISVILSLCHHQMPKSLRCVGGAYLSKDVADTTMTILEFDGNIRSHIYVSWLHPFKEQKLIVVGSSGMAVFDDQRPWETKLVVYKNHVRWEKGIIPQAKKSEAVPILVEQKEPLKEECLHFLNCCNNRSKPRTDGEEGLLVLQVLQAAQLSLSKNGSDVNLKEGLKAKEKMAYFSHPTSTIDDKACIGDGTKIWHYSHIMQEAIIGKRCNIGQNVVVSPEVQLGDNVKIQNNVSVYTGVVCEDDVFLGPSMVFTNVINPRSAVNRKSCYKKTLVRKGVTVGANATVLCGLELGKYAFVGAASVVTKSIAPYALVVGNPAKQVGWMSRHGSKLELPLKSPGNEVLKARCKETNEEYTLYNSKLYHEDEVHILENALEGIKV